MKYENITYSHEHMVIDLRAKGDDDCYLNTLEDALEELHELKKKGVNRIIDCSNRGIGRDIETIHKIRKITGIEIAWSTGFYKDPFLPDEVRNLDVTALSKIMIHEIEEGASFIAEIGTSKEEITPSECKVFEAACIAHHVTGCPIITHTTLGTMAKEQLSLFQKHNVNLKKVILSHTDLRNDEKLMLYLLSTGVNLAFDTIGKISYLSDERRAELISICCKHGYAKQLFLSMDLTRKSHTKKYGGLGYAYLIDTFIPMLEKQGVESKDIRNMVSENMCRLLEEGGRL